MSESVEVCSVDGTVEVLDVDDALTEARKEMFAALAKFQKECPPIPKTQEATIPGKDGKRGYTYKYADLADIREAIRDPLSDNGLAWFQDVVVQSGQVHVSTTVTHSGGYLLVSGPFVLPAGDTPQKAGIATTYGRRYGLSAALGIVTEEDDDAASTSHGGEAPSVRDEPIPMSESQNKLIRAMAAERGLSNADLHGIASRMLGEEVVTLKVLTGGRDGTASRFIDELKQRPVKAEEEPAPMDMADEDISY